MDELISNTIEVREYKEQAKKLGPFAAEYMLHSFSLTFKGGVDHHSDQRIDEKFLMKEFDDGA